MDSLSQSSMPSGTMQGVSIRREPIQMCWRPSLRVSDISSQDVFGTLCSEYASARCWVCISRFGAAHHPPQAAKIYTTWQNRLPDLTFWSGLQVRTIILATTPMMRKGTTHSRPDSSSLQDRLKHLEPTTYGDHRKYHDSAWLYTLRRLQTPDPHRWCD